MASPGTAALVAAFGLSWGAKTIHIVTNHKTGTGFCSAIQHSTDSAIKCSSSHANADVIRRLASKGTYVVNFVRNTHRLVESSYGYHRRCPESWTKTPNLGRGASYKQGEFQGSVAVYLAAQRGRVPPVKPGESYCRYLQRLPARDALVAETIRTQHREFPFMQGSYEATRKSGGINVCLDALTYTPQQMGALWGKILSTAGYHSNTLGQIEAVDIWHGKRFHSGNLSGHRDLLPIIEDIDTTMLHGNLSKISAAMGCTIDGSLK